MSSNRATSEASAGNTASHHGRRKIPFTRFTDEKLENLEFTYSQSRKATEEQTKEATAEALVKSPDVKFEQRSKKAQKKSKSIKTEDAKKGDGEDGTSSTTGRVPPKITQMMKKRRNGICIGVTAVLCVVALIVIAILVGVVVTLPKFGTTAEPTEPTTSVPSRISTTTINPLKPSDTTSMLNITTQDEARNLEAAIRKDFSNDETTKYQEEVYEIGGAYPNVTTLKLLSTTWQIPTENYRPLGYQLRLFVRLPGYGIGQAPIPKKLHWTTLGKVRILIEIDKNPENFIELHSKNLTIKAATLREVQLKNKNESAIFKYKMVGQTRRLAFQHNEEIERVGFGDGKSIVAGTYILEIVYAGEISKTLTGLYLSCTVNSKTKKKSCIATTQMEPTNARMMLPCFDEPRFKAIWSLIIFHPVGTEANSNMNSEFSEINSITGSEAHLTWSITKFANTPTMSSYLLALVVHAWKEPDTITTNNIEIRVYAHPSRKGQTAYAKEIASKTLSSFEKIFGINYPLPKLDLFAIARFEAGAMENWGLMIFREQSLLFDPKHESMAKKGQIRDIVNHEIGHQWFGNLVTMNWWNEVWLNEGFATFAEFLGRLSHMSFDEAVIEYLLNTRSGIMYEEGISAHKRMVEDFKQEYPDGRYNRYPRTPTEIRNMFNKHAYDKGGLGVFSIFKALGSHRFFTNIKAYLDKHKYSTSHSMDVLGEDLFKDQLWTNTQKVLKDHLTNVGLPLSIVSHSNEKQYRVTQKRFVYPQDKPRALPQEYWNLELYFKNEKTKKFETSQFPDLNSDKKEKELIERNLSSTFPPIINMDGRAYTRVCYGKNWPLVFQAFRFMRLPLLTRILIYDDLFSMAAAERVNYKIALEFAYSRLERDVESNHHAFQYLVYLVRSALGRVQSFNDPANEAIIFKAVNELLEITKRAVVSDKKSAKKINTYETQLMEVAEMKVSKTAYRLAHTKEKLLNRINQLQPNSSKLEDAKRLYIERAINPCKADQQLSKCVLDIPFGTREKFYTDAILSESDDKEMIAEHLSKKLEIETDTNEAEKIACALASSKKWKYQEMILKDLIQSLSAPTRVGLQSVEKVMKCLKHNGEKKSHRVNYLLNNTQHIYQSLKGSQNAMNAVYKGLVAAVQSEDDIQKVKEKLESDDLGKHSEIRKLKFWDEVINQYNIEAYWQAHMMKDVLEFYRKRFSAPPSPVMDDPADVDGE